jgi:hypothetical protein
VKKQSIDKNEFVNKRKATLLLGFKNNRTVNELIKEGYLKTYIIDSSKRELLKKSEVLDLPQKDPPPTNTESEVRT